MNTKNNIFGIVIVGDEILSGKRRDSHFDFMVNAIGERGGQLAWARFIGDDLDTQIETYLQTQQSRHQVFSFGGIGATPDDLTREAVATAFKHPLAEHPEGIKILRRRFGEDVTPVRRALVTFPRGSTLIPNPVNQIPGFSLENHHFFPGFPNMAQPMVKWVLDTQYAQAFTHPPDVEFVLLCSDTYESELIPIIEKILATHEGIKIACLPASEHPGQVELGVRGEQSSATKAFETMTCLLNEHHVRHKTPG